jgi:hypothetical protein
MKMKVMVEGIQRGKGVSLLCTHEGENQEWCHMKQTCKDSVLHLNGS